MRRWVVLYAGVVAALVLGGCGGGGHVGAGSGSAQTAVVTRSTSVSGPHPAQSVSARKVVASANSQSSRAPQLVPSPGYPRLLRSAQGNGPTGFVPAALIGGRTAAWVARTASGVGLLSFDQSVVTLALHSGTVDAGTSGWRWGPTVAGAERRQLVAAFNGGFKLATGSGGFMSYGRVAAPLRDGLGSIVTYADGSTDIGAWHQELPAPGQRVVSVRQNLPLLVDHGRAAPNLACVSCWGATLGGVSAPARSALGITAHGRLIWVGGENLTVGDLSAVLLAARVVRAVELDINPEWVAAYLYGHRGGVGPLAPVPVVPTQPGVPGQFLAPYSRDFFTVRAR